MDTPARVLKDSRVYTVTSLLLIVPRNLAVHLQPVSQTFLVYSLTVQYWKCLHVTVLLDLLDPDVKPTLMNVHLIRACMDRVRMLLARTPASVTTAGPEVNVTLI